MAHLQIAHLALSLAFLALNVADVFYTLKIIAKGGRELNPIGAFAQNHFGRYWALYLKVAGVAFVFWINWFVLPLLVATAFLVACCWFYALVIIHNRNVLKGN